jgi:hypothetical protein
MGTGGGQAFFMARHWDDLFAAIEDADKMEAYLETRKSSLQLQLSLLSRTLQVSSSSTKPEAAASLA